MSDDPWLTEISPADIEAARKRKAAREALIAEQATEIARLRALCDRQSTALSLSGMRHGRILVGLERRNARQRRALAKMYQRRHDKNAEIARLRAAINNALLEPWLDGQLGGTWQQNPIGPNETPEEAIKRLVSVRAEWAVYKNNCENPVIAELRTACDASEERERAIELRFWQTVDRDGLTGLPSDMWAALEQLVQDRAALATTRREGVEMPTKFLEWIKDQMPSDTFIHNPEWWARKIWKAAIRARREGGEAMTEPTISDLNAAYAELEHWVAKHLSIHGGSVRFSLENIRICPGFTGAVKGSGATLSAAIYAALEQLRVVRATVPPIPRDAGAKEDRQP